jgi:hypothetical protein
VDLAFSVSTGHTLTLSGTSSFDGTLDGPGTLKITGSGNIQFLDVATNSGATAATIEDAGTITQSSRLTLNGLLQIDRGASYTITTATTIADDGATTVNNGTFTDDSGGGTSSLNGTFTNNGYSGDTLALSGTDTINGTVSGAGTLDFGFAANATINTTKITVGTILIAGGNGGGTLTLTTISPMQGPFCSKARSARSISMDMP